MPRLGLNVTGGQLRAARAFLNLSVTELAERTGLAINTIRRAEGTNGPSPVTAANLSAMVEALEEGGVMFVPADELGPGVRLRSVDPAAIGRRRRERL